MAERPRHLVLPLIALGGAASAANLLSGYGAGSDIIGWRTLLACAVAAGIFAIFNLYVLAVVTGWVGRKMGGVASNDAVRAVFAWGMLPSIVGTCGRSVDCRRLAHIRAWRGAEVAVVIIRPCERRLRALGAGRDAD